MLDLRTMKRWLFLLLIFLTLPLFGKFYYFEGTTVVTTGSHQYEENAGVRMGVPSPNIGHYIKACVFTILAAGENAIRRPNLVNEVLMAGSLVTTSLAYLMYRWQFWRFYHHKPLLIYMDGEWNAARSNLEPAAFDFFKSVLLGNKPINKTARFWHFPRYPHTIRLTGNFKDVSIGQRYYETHPKEFFIDKIEFKFWNNPDIFYDLSEFRR